MAVQQEVSRDLLRIEIAKLKLVNMPNDERPQRTGSGQPPPACHAHELDRRATAQETVAVEIGCGSPPCRISLARQSLPVRTPHRWRRFDEADKYGHPLRPSRASFAADRMLSVGLLVGARDWRKKLGRSRRCSRAGPRGRTPSQRKEVGPAPRKPISLGARMCEHGAPRPKKRKLFLRALRERVVFLVRNRLIGDLLRETRELPDHGIDGRVVLAAAAE